MKNKIPDCKNCEWNHNNMGTQADGGHCYMFSEIVMDCAQFQNISHYKWLETNLMPFFEKLGINTNYYNKGLISAHGDKCYGYESKFKKNGINFYHGAALYLLTYVSPYSKEVRETENGFVKPENWIIKNYSKFKDYLPEIN